VLEAGDRVIVASRPDHHDPGAWPLEDGVRWLVVTFDGELVSELKGCWTRADAFSYAAACGRGPGPAQGPGRSAI
jgi:hypothetical protein